MHKLRFALIGCGRIIKKHVDALKQIPEAEIVAVCDLNEEKACSWAQKIGCNHYTDYHEMFQKEQFDVVEVLTDSANHAAITIDVAKYGKHIVVEKPMCLKLRDADRMIQECDKYGAKLFVVKQNRFNKAIQHAREAFEQGRFGKMVLGTVRVRWMRDQAYYDQADWRGTWWGDGGVLTNQASHHIDMLEWFFGEPESVMAMTATQLVDIETEDTAVAIVRFMNGSLGVIEATTATRPKDLEGSFSILGEKGSVVVGGFAMNELVTWQFTEQKPEDKDASLHKEQPDNVYGYGHYEYLKNVIHAIQTNSRGLVDGLEARKSIEFLNALYESAETGKKVSLRYTQNASRLGEDRK